MTCISHPFGGIREVGPEIFFEGMFEQGCEGLETLLEPEQIACARDALCAAIEEGGILDVNSGPVRRAEKTEMMVDKRKGRYGMLTLVYTGLEEPATSATVAACLYGETIEGQSLESHNWGLALVTASRPLSEFIIYSLQDNPSRGVPTLMRRRAALDKPTPAQVMPKECAYEVLGRMFREVHNKGVQLVQTAILSSWDIPVINKWRGKPRGNVMVLNRRKAIAGCYAVGGDPFINLTDKEAIQGLLNWQNRRGLTYTPFNDDRIPDATLYAEIRGVIEQIKAIPVRKVPFTQHPYAPQLVS